MYVPLDNVARAVRKTSHKSLPVYSGASGACIQTGNRDPAREKGSENLRRSNRCTIMTNAGWELYPYLLKSLRPDCASSDFLSLAWKIRAEPCYGWATLRGLLDELFERKAAGWAQPPRVHMISTPLVNSLLQLLVQQRQLSSSGKDIT